MHKSNNNINGFMAESLVENWSKECSKIKLFKLPSSQELVALAQTREIGKKRLEKAKAYLIKEFGFQYRSQDKLVLSFDWEQVPPRIILDYVFGIDIILNICGHIFAIDVTVNPKRTDSKIDNLHRLKPLWKKLGIDKACVCLIKNHENDPTKIWSILKSIIKTSESVTQVII